MALELSHRTNPSSPMGIIFPSSERETHRAECFTWTYMLKHKGSVVTLYIIWIFQTCFQHHMEQHLQPLQDAKPSGVFMQLNYVGGTRRTVSTFKLFLNKLIRSQTPSRRYVAMESRYLSASLFSLPQVPLLPAAGNLPSLYRMSIEQVVPYCLGL